MKRSQVPHTGTTRRTPGGHFRSEVNETPPITGSGRSVGKVLLKIALRREHTAPNSHSSGHYFPRIRFSAVHALTNFCRNPGYCSCWQGILWSLHDAGFVGMQSARVTGSWDFHRGFRRTERLSSVRQGQDRSRELLRGQSCSCNSDAEDTPRPRKQVFGNVEHLPRKAAGTSRASLGGQLHGLSWWGCRGGHFQDFGVYVTPT